MPSEKSLIDAVKAGDIEKYSQLVTLHSGKIFALANSLLKNREDAEEITQDVFLNAFKSLENFRGDSKFSSYLYRICYNESMNRIRSRKIEVDIDQVIIEETDINDGFFQIKHAEQKKYLMLALEKLNPDYGMVLTLFYLEEQSYNEIVDMTGMSLSNVKVRLHRARHALAKVLNDLLKDEVENLY